MEPKNPSILPQVSIFFFFIIFLLLPSLICAQICQRACGKDILKYPFGSGPGCGDPIFQPHISCSEQRLTFKTHTGSYYVNSIDYTNQVLFISDPTMSTCSFTVPSKGFGLNSDAPFTFDDSTIFTLLDCSNNSSSICTTPVDSDDNGVEKISKLLCDQGTPICNLFYSCRPISTINMPISSCCVYTPVNFGPSFEMDLQKVQCSSYSGFYGYNDQESDPEKWNYGIAIKYKFSVTNDFPTSCAACERSYGVCGYSSSSSASNSFICNCPNGINTTNDCYFPSYNSAITKGFAWLIHLEAWFLVWFFLCNQFYLF